MGRQKETFDVDLGKILVDWDRRRKRSRQTKLGPSSVGECRRRAAYIIARQPYDNWGDPLKAIMGTLLHRESLKACRTAHGGAIEVKLENERIRGSADWLRWDPLGLPILDDLKTKGKDVWDDVLRRNLTRPNLFQIHLYGDMLRRGEIADDERQIPREPVDVVEVEIIYLCRDDGRTASRRVPFEQDIADEAWAWLDEVEKRVEVDGVGLVPRDHPGPESSVICRNCPFLRACWGEQDDSGQRPPLPLGEEELREWVEEYEAARVVEAEAAKRKKLARGHLDGQEPQEWSDGWKLGWTGGNVSVVEEPDVDALVDLVQRAGLVVPIRQVEKRSSRNISVKPPKRSGK